MSGPASVILAFSAAYFEYVVKHGRAVMWIAAALCFIVTSYRVWSCEYAKNRQLETRLTPILTVLFGTDEPFAQVRESPDDNQTITYYGIQIQNVGNSTAQRVRVEVEGFQEPGGTYRKLSYFQPNIHQPETSLDLKETRESCYSDHRKEKGPELSIPMSH